MKVFIVILIVVVVAVLVFFALRKKTFTYVEAMKYFAAHKNDNPKIAKGALLKEEISGGGFMITQAFLDKSGNTVCDDKGVPLGSKLKVSALDEELVKAFKNAKMIVVE
jgi:uncharacterized protein YneF (UPF0154 family)